MKNDPLRPKQVITFPLIVASLGGALGVVYSHTFAWIEIPSPGGSKTVRIPRSKLPENPGDWSAFTLADIARYHATP